MKIQVLLLACIFAIPIYAQQDSVIFSLDAPDNVVAGNEFEVTLTFNKGDLKDYSRFSQELPAGFDAENIVSPNADFTFDEQRIRIIWLKLPADKVIEVKYLISVNERLKGQLELDGTFAYVIDGERAYLQLDQPIMVEVLPNPSLDPELVVDIEEYPNVMRPANMKEVEEGSQVDFATVVRQEPVVAPNGIVTVRLLVKTPPNINFMKLEESIPGGYSFESLESAGATVSQAASLARYVWMKSPDAGIFTISYRLVPILEQEQEPVLIRGNLSYNSDGETQNVKPRQVGVNLSALTLAQKEELMKTGKVSGEVADLKTDEARELTGTSAKEKEPEKASGNQTTTARKTPVSPVKKVEEYEKSSGSTIVEIDNLKARDGVYFRVQVAALKNTYFARTYFADYPLLRDVKVEHAEGWNKYTVGSFSSYSEAEGMKSRIMRETPVKSAFVAAYRDGRRVPVEDVL